MNTVVVPYAVEVDEKGFGRVQVPVLFSNGVTDYRAEFVINSAGDMAILSKGVRYPVVGIKAAGDEQAIVKSTSGGGRMMMWFDLRAWSVIRPFVIARRQAAAAE